MARNFVSASTQQLTLASSPVSAMPFTLACRLKAGSWATTPWVFTIGSGTEIKWASIDVRGTGVVRATHTGGVGVIAAHGTAASTGVWVNAVAVFTSATSRSINYNNLTKVTETTDISGDFTYAMLTLGSYRDGSFGNSNYLDGDMADAAIWNVALDDAEQAAFMSGVSPLLIRPQSLQGYWPLTGLDSPELDRWKNRYDLTLVNTPVKAESPLTFNPTSGQLAGFVAGAFTLALDIGTYSVTGVAAALRAARRIVNAVGSYTLTGSVAALVHGISVTLVAGTYTLTGSAMTFVQRFVKRVRVSGSYIRSKLMKGSLGRRRPFGS